jgi:demethylmenaquinone methyltransferase/2-methoxy-6-polyprenyl-1,4-benzoquinol methylase
MEMCEDELDALLAEQIAYYRARASEYDATVPLDEASRAMLRDALDQFAPRGRVLELACDTGQWTALLTEYASDLTAVDGGLAFLPRVRRTQTSRSVLTERLAAGRSERSPINSGLRGVPHHGA